MRFLDISSIRVYNISDMSLKSEILRQLKNAEGRSVSGQTLAERYAVSRAAVWKAVAALKKDGYAVVGSPKTGYRLSPSDVFNEEELLFALRKIGFNADTGTSLSEKASKGRLSVRFFETVGSTNEYAKKLAAEGEKTPTVVAACEQTDGRARKGKFFPSERGGLYASFLFFPLSPTETQPLLLERIYDRVNRVLCGERRENEIYVDGTKACGVLTEFAADPDLIRSCVVGVGVYPSLLFPDVAARYPSRADLCAALAEAVFGVEK